MPPPPPDRRDFLYRDGRRHDGAGGEPLPPAAPTPPRWRDSLYYPPPPPIRDHARPSPRRTTSSASSEGYYRQGGGAYERSYPDEPLGYTPSRSDRYWLEEDAGGIGYKGFGRYGGGGRRDGRDMRGSYRRSPFRSYGGDFPRGHQEPPPPLRRSPLRSVAVPICYDPPGDREDRDHQARTTPWWPLRQRENRSDASEAVCTGLMSVGHNSQAGSASEKKAPAQSLAEAAPQTAEEEAPRKKPRLGWGQGLAKYEKQKVHGSGDSAEAVADGSQADIEPKADVSTTASVPCASPVAEPAPPPSSTVPEEKSCDQTANMVTVSNEDITGAEVQAFKDEIPTKLGQLHGDPLCSLPNVLDDMLQHDDCCSGDSKGLTNTSKLLVLNESITKELERTEPKELERTEPKELERTEPKELERTEPKELERTEPKELEITELEIDSLEVELKLVNAESGNRVLEVAQNPPPSSGTSENPVSAEICETLSPVNVQGELAACKISVELDADAEGAELMEIDTSPICNVNTVSSEESVSCPGVAEDQIAAAADVAPLKPSSRPRAQIDGSERYEVNPCHDNVNSQKADGSNYSSIRPWSYPVNNRNLIPSILAMNNDIAKERNDLVLKPLSADQPNLNLSSLSLRKDDLNIKEKLAVQKNRLRFKEQILTFKFKVLRYLWKEDVRLLSVRKQRPKSNKRTDLSNRASQSGSHRQHSSNRSRLGMSAGNLSTLPTSEILEVATKMFSEFHFKRCRNYLKMPALIIDETKKARTKFVSKNGLVEDPVSVEKERAMINVWAHEEKEVFMQMLATFGKDFSKISNFLQHKTTADCVEFYYKHHKSESFCEVKKLLDRRQQQQPTSNYLGTKSGKKWNPEGNAASLDMLGVASVVAAHGLDYANKGEKISVKNTIRTFHKSDISVAAKGYLEKDCVANIPLHERESVAADVLAGICGTLSPEGMGSCITSSADPGQKIGTTRMDHVLMPEVDKSFDDDGTISDQECEIDSVDWNDDEKSMFIEAMKNYGKNFIQISSFVKSKSYEQCKVFFSKARKSLGLDMIHQHNADAGLPTSDTNGGTSDTDEACAAEMDTNEGRSDTDEACAVEMQSAICSTQSSLKIQLDVCPADRNGTIRGHPLSDVTFKQPETDGSNGPDVVDIKFEEVEIKAEDGNCNVLVDTHQASCPSIDINCSENTENMQNGEKGNQVSMHDNGTMVSSREQAVTAHLEVRSSLNCVDVIQSSKASEGICTQFSRMEGSSHHAPVSALVQAGNFTLSVSLPGDCGGKENIIHFSDTAGVSSIRPAVTSSYQQTMPADLLPSNPKPQVTPLTPKDCMPVQFSSALPDPTSIHFEDISSTTSPFEDHGNVIISSSGKDMNTFNVQAQNQHDDMFRNIDGYMEQSRNHHLAAEVPAFSGSTASGTVGISHSDQFTITKFQNGRSSSSGLSNASAAIQWTGNNNEARERPLKPCPHKATAESCNQVKRPGDVKLFGKILSHQSTMQGSGSLSNGSKSKPPSPKIDKSIARLLSNSRDRMVYSSRPASTSQLGLDERVARSYTNIDGSTVHPDSVFMMAKCQSSLADVPFYSTKNDSLGVFPEYQQPLIKRLPSDARRLESIADLQKNGMDVISGYQQPGKASRPGGGGILVSGVSDPVAALKAQYGPGSKILGSSDAGPWNELGNR